MRSALRLASLSDEPEPLTVETLPGGFPEPSIVDNFTELETVISSALYTFRLTTFFALDNEDCKRGWTWPIAVEASGSSTVLLTRRVRFGDDSSFGDDDNEVAVVAAVRGRSPVVECIASREGGSFPVNSSFRIRDFISSRSSQTVEGAVVEMVDSVPSYNVLSAISAGWRLLRMVERVE